MYKAMCDASVSKEKGARAGIVIFDSNKTLVWQKSIKLSSSYINVAVAEYWSVYLAANKLKQLGVDGCTIYTDNLSLVQQMYGEVQQSSNNDIRSIHEELQNGIKYSYRLAWISRKHNKLADKLSRDENADLLKNKGDELINTSRVQQINDDLFRVYSASKASWFVVNANRKNCACSHYLSDNFCGHINKVEQLIREQEKNKLIACSSVLYDDVFGNESTISRWPEIS